jgi:hypothetical protein
MRKFKSVSLVIQLTGCVARTLLAKKKKTDYRIGISVSHMFFLATSHTKNTISEKTLKHTIQLIYPKKRYEHTLFLKVIIITFN